jgi:GTP-binding protein EngB required for normal cell division
MEQGALDQARAALASLPPPEVLDGGGWLLQARLLETTDPSAALFAYRRALLLDVHGAAEHAAHFVARTGEAAVVSALRAIVESLDYGELPLWKAAFATADGHPERALAALGEGARTDPELVEQFVHMALELQNSVALRDAVELARQHRRGLDPAITALDQALRLQHDALVLRALDAATGPAESFAHRRRRELYGGWFPSNQATNWSSVLPELGTLARELGVFEALRDIEALAVDLERPLRVAVVGEFNAGKSSFINALLGEAVAPVGVLPTTATENRLAWAPDRFVRIARVAGCPEPDRTVAPADLDVTLSSLDTRSIAHVTIYAPLELLRRIELIDTPGFNAPDVSHIERAQAAFEHAHVAIWLFDAAQPLKESERAVLSKIGALDTPFLVLLNKADRLLDGADQTAVDRALEYVKNGLVASSLEPISPPIALSARSALRARQDGDESLLARSNWAALEQLVERELVAQSSTLREGALRRQAKGVIQKLVTRVYERQRDRQYRAVRLDEQRRRLRHVLDQLDARTANVHSLLLKELDARLHLLEQELKPASGMEREAAAQPFIANRSRRVLGAGLAERLLAELAIEGEGSEVARTEIIERAEAISVAVAPILLQKARTEQDVVHYREHIGRLLIEEARRVLERALTGSERVAAPTIERRVLALANVLLDEQN